MKDFRLRFERILPKYAWLPAISLLVMNFVSYYIPKLLEHGRVLHPLSTALDDALPRVPFFIYIYVLAYVQWFIAYTIILRDSRELCFRFTAAELLAKTLGMAILLIYPTTMHRPDVEVTGLTTWVLNLVYRCDTPTNLFPSMHCLASWLCFRRSLELKRMPRCYAWIQGLFSMLVFISVLLTKQHVWPDIFGGIATAELGILLCRLLHSDRLFAKLDRSARSHV